MLVHKKSVLPQEVSELMDLFCFASHPQLAVSLLMGFVPSLVIHVILPQVPLLLPQSPFLSSFYSFRPFVTLVNVKGETLGHVSSSTHIP